MPIKTTAERDRGIAVLNAPDPPVNMEPAKMDPIDDIMAGLASDPFERAALAVLG